MNLDEKPKSVTAEKITFDLRPYITWFNNSKAGGQNANKTMNMVRINHIPSGVCVVGTAHRDRTPNLKDACKALEKHPKFRYWCHLMKMQIESGVTLEQEVEVMMSREQDFKVEVKKDGKWVEENDRIPLDK
jgi:hypothetical protein